MSLPRRNDVAVAFGSVLRAARNAKDISQETLSADAQFDRTYPSMLERGLRCPSLACVIAIAAALKISPITLVTDTLAQLHRRSI